MNGLKERQYPRQHGKQNAQYDRNTVQVKFNKIILQETKELIQEKTIDSYNKHHMHVLWISAIFKKD